MEIITTLEKKRFLRELTELCNKRKIKIDTCGADLSLSWDDEEDQWFPGYYMETYHEQDYYNFEWIEIKK